MTRGPLVTWIKFPDKKARILRRPGNGAAAAFRAHLNLYVEKLDVHCNYADALPAILVNNTVALNRYILGWLITHSLT